MKRQFFVIPAIRDHFRECGIWYFVCSLFFLAGLLLGAFSKIDFFSYKIKIFVSGSFGKCFFGLFFTALIILALAILCNLVIYSMPIAFVLIIFNGFLLGRNCVLIVNVLNITGVIYIILFYIPFQLLFNFILMGGIILLLKRNMMCFRCKLHFCTDLKITINKLLFFAIMIIIAALIYALLYSFLYSAVIVIKI